MPRNNDYEPDDRYRTSHPSVREERRTQRQKNIAGATSTLIKGTREDIRDLVGDPFADKE